MVTRGASRTSTILLAKTLQNGTISADDVTAAQGSKRNTIEVHTADDEAMTAA